MNSELSKLKLWSKHSIWYKTCFHIYFLLHQNWRFCNFSISDCNSIDCFQLKHINFITSMLLCRYFTCTLITAFLYSVFNPISLSIKREPLWSSALNFWLVIPVNMIPIQNQKKFTTEEADKIAYGRSMCLTRCMLWVFLHY